MHTFQAPQQEAMPQIGDPKMAFAHLRPACVLLSRQPTLHNVETLSGQLREVEHATLQQLQDYVLFPLRLVLKGGGGAKKEKVVQAVVEAMTQVLEKTCVQSWETLRQLFSELCLCLCSPCDPGKPADTSEELKLAVLRCLDALLHAAYGDIVFKLFQAAMLPGLGAAVSLLLALAEKDACRDVRAAALKSLQALTMQCDCSQDHVVPCSEEREELGASFASFLPGIASSVARVVAGDVRQGHAVTVRAIKVWSRTVSLVMEDAQLQSSGPQKSSQAHLSKLEQLMVHRTQDWVKKTSERLCVLLKKIISSTVAHQHWRVRLEVLELADHLLDRCGGSLGQCVGLLLEVLVGAVNDVDPRVRERCELALSAASQTIQTSSKAKDTERKSSFTDVLSENLHSLASSLPRLMRTYDDQKKLFVLNVLLGYLKLLGPLVSVVLNSAVHLHRISKALMQVLDLDVTDVRIVEERGHGALIETGSGSLHCVDVRRKRFLFFTDDAIFSVLTEICQTLGYYGNIYLLTDHFLDLYRQSYRQSSVYRKQAAMVLNQIIRGAAEGMSSASQEDLRASVMLVLEEYISLNNWHVNMVAQDSGSHGQDQKVKNNWHVNMVAQDSGSHGQDQKVKNNWHVNMVAQDSGSHGQDQKVKNNWHVNMVAQDSGSHGQDQKVKNNWHVNMVAQDSGSHGQDQKVKNNWHVNMVAQDSGSHGQDQKLLMFSMTHSPQPSSSSMSTLRQLNSNIWQVCIQLEGVACFAQALGRDFRPLLMTSLYPVLEKAGEQTLLISQAALNAMWAISEACGYSSLKDMIADNSDYLLNDISLNLQRLGQHPQAPGVLTVMLRHSDCSLLPLVADLLHDVLMALDLNYQHMAATFCSVLYSLMTSLAKWFPSSCNRTKKSCRSQQNSADQEVFDVRHFLLEYCKQKDLAEGLGMGQDDLDGMAGMGQDDLDEDYDDDGGPEEKADLPSAPAPAEEDYDGDGGPEEKADLPSAPAPAEEDYDGDGGPEEKADLPSAPAPTEEVYDGDGGPEEKADLPSAPAPTEEVYDGDGGPEEKADLPSAPAPAEEDYDGDGGPEEKADLPSAPAPAEEDYDGDGGPEEKADLPSAPAPTEEDYDGDGGPEEKADLPSAPALAEEDYDGDGGPEEKADLPSAPAPAEEDYDGDGGPEEKADLPSAPAPAEEDYDDDGGPEEKADLPSAPAPAEEDYDGDGGPEEKADLPSAPAPAEEDYDGDGGPEEKADLPSAPAPAEEDYDGDGGPEEKADLPLHLNMSKEVMERCIHLLSDSSLQLRLKVLHVLQLCIRVLAEREDELLPLAHRCWPPLLQRLTTDDPPVVLQAFKVLCTLAASCGDFLRSRVSKDLVPKLSSWLIQQAGISAQATPVYCQSLAYRMQLLLLEGLGSLCQSLDLAEADVHAVSEACLPYLSCRQPVTLQQACLRCFQKMIQVDPDTLWLTLTELHCDLPLPPHPHLPPLQLWGRGRPRDEYSDNVLHLLREDFDH
ncbi:TELO2-interacting protein 1 homolog isoform X2 [Nerophis ophidion]|uniref:TELO2-interacting protein 1 homolog isoform X2 n=1 Tax=Nerophis ophidion TaxID=159077 RepID=UPI002AE00411|nr:TELO2-interacting protein 1 homolog isoform X2 [Nerophis ophidion]